MMQQPHTASSNFGPPFHLVYQGQNDRDLKQTYARLFSIDEADRQPPTRSGKQLSRRYRIGFLVTRYHETGLCRFLGGIINHLSPADFEISIVCHRRSEETIRPFLTRADVRFVHFAENIAGSVLNLKRANLDLLYYWEVGTDLLNYFLPFFRPAPVQCTSWGTPSTTGLPEMNYFLSSALFEPDRAHVHYTEQLVPLQTLGMHYDRPVVANLTKTRADLGLSETEHIYLCTQNLPKFHPEFDRLLAEVLRHDGRGRILVKAKQQHFNELLLARWQRRIPDVIDRIEFVPHQSYDDYLNLMKVADVLLDTVHYSGGTTSFEAIAVGTPIVTLPGEYMRGRMTYGCYQKIGVLDTVVNSAEAYVAKAVQLATDQTYQAHIRQKISAASDALYEDVDAVRELEQFFRQAIAQDRSQ